MVIQDLWNTLFVNRQIMLSRLMAPDPPPRVRGGWRQVDEVARSRSPPRTTHCRSSISHLQCWGERGYSTVRLWRFMQEMNADGFFHPSIHRLAAIGAGGERHCLQNLEKLLKPHTDLFNFLSQVEGDGLVSHCIKPSTAFQNCCKTTKPNSRRISSGDMWTRFKNSGRAFFLARKEQSCDGCTLI